MTENWETRWKDYYKILQVHTAAEPEVIKAAYDRLARKYHPDVNRVPTANTRMQEINEAFEILSNLDKRRQYHAVWLQKTGMSNTVQGTTDIQKARKGQKRAIHIRRDLLIWGILLIVLIIAAVIFFVNNQAQAPGLNSTPNVKIQSITLPSNAKVSSGDLVYPQTIRIVNNGSYDLRLYWEGSSSITGKMDSGYITVLKNSYRDLTRSYYYTEGGIEEVTYSLYYSGILLDKYSATHIISQ